MKMNKFQRFYQNFNHEHPAEEQFEQARQSGIIKSYFLTTMGALNARRVTDFCLWCDEIWSVDHKCECAPDYNCRFTFGEEFEGVAFVKLARDVLKSLDVNVLLDESCHSSADKMLDEVSTPNTSSLKEELEMSGAHQVFDGMSNPNCGLNYELSVGIDLGSAQTTPSVSHTACAKTSDARKVLDEMPLPDFIREMAQSTNIEDDNFIESNHRHTSVTICNNKYDTLIYERQLFAKLGAQDDLFFHNLVIMGAHHSRFGKLLCENELCYSNQSSESQARNVSVSIPTYALEDKGGFRGWEDKLYSNYARKLSNNAALWRTECCKRMGDKIHVFDPGLIWLDCLGIVALRVKHVTTIFVAKPYDLFTVGPYSLAKPILCVIFDRVIFDPGGYYKLLGMASADIVMTFRGNSIKSASATMASLDPIGTITSESCTTVAVNVCCDISYGIRLVLQVGKMLEYIIKYLLMGSIRKREIQSFFLIKTMLDICLNCCTITLLKKNSKILCATKVDKVALLLAQPKILAVVFLGTGGTQRLSSLVGLKKGVTNIGLKPRCVAEVAVIGGGLMGSGIAAALLLGDVQGNIRGLVAQKKSVQENAQKALLLLKDVLDYSKFKDVDLVNEAVIEIDGVITNCGMPMGAYPLQDLAGYGITLAAGKEFDYGFPDHTYKLSVGMVNFEFLSLALEHIGLCIALYPINYDLALTFMSIIMLGKSNILGPNFCPCWFKVEDDQLALKEAVVSVVNETPEYLRMTVFICVTAKKKATTGVRVIFIFDPGGDDYFLRVANADLDRNFRGDFQTPMIIPASIARPAFIQVRCPKCGNFLSPLRTRVI